VDSADATVVPSPLLYGQEVEDDVAAGVERGALELLQRRGPASHLWGFLLRGRLAIGTCGRFLLRGRVLFWRRWLPALVATFLLRLLLREAREAEACEHRATCEGAAVVGGLGVRRLGHAKRLTLAGRFEWINKFECLEENGDDVPRPQYQYIVRAER
jgi:hypothetical protein